MAIDLFEQLASEPVPPPPPSFDRDVHERLNKRLLIMQIVELGTGAMFHALVHFMEGLGGLVIFTLSGRYPVERRPEERRDLP